MCLSKITNNKRQNISGTGWKIVGNWNLPPDKFYSPVRFVLYSYNKNLKSSSVKLLGGCNTIYKSGFHIFKTRQAARKHWIWQKRNSEDKLKIVKVNYKDIICEGLDDNSETLIVKEMFVPKEQIS
jgi:hypothetical protein